LFANIIAVTAAVAINEAAVDLFVTEGTAIKKELSSPTAPQGTAIRKGQ